MMKKIIKKVKIGNKIISISLPACTDILTMVYSEKVKDPESALLKQLLHPIGVRPLPQIVDRKIKKNPDSKAVIVISDNTRPVPYKGNNGILWPIINILLKKGVKKENIIILIANGTHHELGYPILTDMLDSRVFEEGISIVNHKYSDKSSLKYIGNTSRGTKIYINNLYLNADIKILTGLVESHFMAGVSGGRKSVCPGLAGQETINAFHSPLMLNNRNTRDLKLKGNPCHEEATEILERVGADFTVNVTLNKDYQVTGIYAGNFNETLVEAYKRIKKYSSISINREYDIVITHAGLVGINHYQAAKAAVVSLPALKKDGHLILFADNTDKDPVGSTSYKSVLYLLKILGAKKFNQLLLSSSWKLIHDQWQVQMWSRVFKKIPIDNLIYYSPQLSESDFVWIPAKDGNDFIPAESRYNFSYDNISTFINNCLAQLMNYKKDKGYQHVSVAYLRDGPYGILLKKKKAL